MAPMKRPKSGPAKKWTSAFRVVQSMTRFKNMPKVGVWWDQNTRKGGNSAQMPLPPATAGNCANANKTYGPEGPIGKKWQHELDRIQLI